MNTLNKNRELPVVNESLESFGRKNGFHTLLVPVELAFFLEERLLIVLATVFTKFFSH